MTSSLNFESQKQVVKNLSKTMTRKQLESFLLSGAEKMGMEIFKKQASEEILHLTKPADVIPAVYGEYRQIVCDGILFLLLNFSPARLISLITDQLLLEDHAAPEERLITLAAQLPTLHKLGQILARNKNVETSFKKRLIRLENGFRGADIAEVRHRIEREIKGLIRVFSIKIGDEILAEASVGAVVPFTWTSPGTERRKKGVFKILRPGVKRRLDEELYLLEELAAFFDKNRHRYSLRNFRFIETFRDIRAALQQEIDLAGEQANLRKASLLYKGNKGTRIPRLLPFSTERLTVMEHMNGGKITDVYMSGADKKTCARNLFHTVIGNPLFSYEEWTFFHGDPHAGNIYAFEDEKNGGMKIALLDWSQAGYLSKNQRMNMLRLAVGVVMRNHLIREAVENLAADHPGADATEEIIRDIVSTREYTGSSFVKKIFLLIDQSAVRGIRFPTDLLLFRKSFFTLEGVLYDLDPSFDMDAYMMKLLEDIFVEELPKRWMYFLFPQSDGPEHYKTLLSNYDLQLLGSRLVLEGFKKGAGVLSAFMEKNMEGLIAGSFNWMRYFLFRPL
jgi:ubiquinone biosynthesis protein